MDHAEATGRFYKDVWPLRATVLRTARYLCRDQTDAEDLAQETLMKAFRAIETFDKPTNPSGWLMAILRNTWIDRMRSAGGAAGDVSLEGSEMDVADERNTAVEVDPRDVLALLERMSDQELIGELKRLPEEIRWTLLLVDVEQMDFQDAAVILDVPVGTVKSRASRGRRMLRDALCAGRVRM